MSGSPYTSPRQKIHRYSGEFHEEHCLPEPFAEHLHDEIAELLSPLKVPPSSMANLVEFIESRKRLRDDAPPLPVEDRLKSILKRLPSSRADLINRWAFLRVIGSPAENEMTEADVARILDVSRETVSNRVRDWQRILGVPKLNHSAAIQSGHRTRKRKGYTYRTPTGGRGKFYPSP